MAVVSADVADLQRGRHLSHAGANLAVFDLFDAGIKLYFLLLQDYTTYRRKSLAIPGLLGSNCLRLLEAARRRILRPGATVVPAAASVYCMGVEVLTRDRLGFDMSLLNRFRYMGKENRETSSHSCLMPSTYRPH